MYAYYANGDGYLDVFSTSTKDNKIAWHENMGQRVFGPQQIISTNFGAPNYIAFGDVDGDGYIDIISGSSIYMGDIVWFKNTDGQGSFMQQQTLSNEPATYKSAVVVDIDGDGDLDIAAVLERMNGQSVAVWFKNKNGLGNFDQSPKQIVETGVSYDLFCIITLMDLVILAKKKLLVWNHSTMGLIWQISIMMMI